MGIYFPEVLIFQVLYHLTGHCKTGKLASGSHVYFGKNIPFDEMDTRCGVDNATDLARL